jgi:NADH-quinone oxidoreductase subunit E
MRRYDLRHLKDDFYDRMVELIDQGLKVNEVGIFMFEVGDFSSIQKSADVIKETGHDLMNSLKFNEVDWTVVVKKVSEETRKERAEAFAVAKKEAEEKAAKAAKIAEEKEAEKAKKLAEKEAAKAAAEAKSNEDGKAE